MRVSIMIAAFAALPATVSLGYDAYADEKYPARPISLIVPYPPGGGTDTGARWVADALSRYWSQPVVVQNYAGADGAIGAQRVLRAEPDGYTLLMPVNQMLLWHVSQPHTDIEVLKDFRFISKIQDSPLALAVSSEVPAQSVGELVDYCKENKCSWGSGAVYSQMIGKQLMDVAGVMEIVQVPYKGTAPMLTDLAGGHITLGIAPVAALLPYSKNGTVRVLGMVSKDRASLLPDILTLEEQGYPVYGTGWYGIVAPSGTPEQVITEISDAIQHVSVDESLRQLFLSGGGKPIFSTPEEFERSVQSEMQDLAPIIQKYPPISN